MDQVYYISNLPVELMLKTLLELDKPEIKNLCSANSRINSVCKANEDYIFKILLERDYGKWVLNPKKLSCMNIRLGIWKWPNILKQEWLLLAKAGY